MASNFFNKASLVMVPDAPIDGIQPSVKPEDRSGDFTFTRGSNLAATRVNKSQLIEKGRENVLLQSNQFDNTPWTNANTTELGGQEGYDGANDAWLLNGTGEFPRIQQNISSSGVNTISVYAKANTNNYLFINMIVNATGAYACFDLVNQTETLDLATKISSNIADIGNGWCRVSLAFSGTLGQVNFGMSNDGSVSGWINFTSGSIYIQDAQLEQGLGATEYIETTTAAVQKGILENLPRIDYSGGASCPSLLLEPSRTNLFQYSEWFDGWTTSGSPAPTLTANYAESPEGVDNAYRVEIPSVSGVSFFAQLVSHTSGTDMTVSAYVKSNTATDQSFKLFGDYGTGTGTSGALTATSEWQRFKFTFTPTATGNRNAGIINVANTAADLLVYGMQVETGNYPTSYIPTYSTSVTRSQDIANLTDSVPNMIGANSFTFFYDCILTTPRSGSGTFSHLDLDGIIGIKGASNTSIRVHCIGSNNFSTSVPILDLSSGRHKFAITLNSNGVGHYFVDGVKQTGEITYSGSGFVGNDCKIDGGAYNQKGNQLLIFPTALSDDECIALTTI